MSFDYSKSASGSSYRPMADVMQLGNKLQSVFKVTSADAVKLPQIVVVGPQSSGKSSVLESFVRRSFLPRGAGMVTKCPIILCLINNRAESGAATSGYGSTDGASTEYEDFEDADSTGSTEPTEYVVFGHKKGQKFTDYNLVREEISDQTILRVGKKCGISAEPIYIEVHSPNVVNLTLVDLPGLVKVAKKDEDKNIEEQVEQIVMEYISNENSIILAICEANIDFNRAEGLKFAQKVDPNGDRTLAVLTKLDLMDRGTDAIEILTGNSEITVKLGIIGVVNRSAKDLKANVTIEESLRKEQKFLRDNYGTLADRNGTIYLENKLALMLRDHIIKCLPQVMAQVNDQIPIHEKQLKEIGGDEIPHKAETMLGVLKKFDSAYKAELEGSSTNLEINRLIGAARIRHIFNKILAQRLSSIDPLSEITDRNIIYAIISSRGYRHSVFLAEDAFQFLVKDQMLKMGDCAQECATLVHTELKYVVKKCLDISADRFPRLNSTIEAVVIDLLTESIATTKTFLQEYIEIEAAYIKTSDSEFVGKMKTTLKELDATLEDLPTSEEDETIELSTTQVEKCKAVKCLISDFFQVVRKQAQDFIPRVIAAKYLDYSVEHVHQTLIRKLYPGRIDELIRVSDHIIMRREMILKSLMELQRADEILKEVLGTDGEISMF